MSVYMGMIGPGIRVWQERWYGFGRICVWRSISGGWDATFVFVVYGDDWA